MGRIYRFVRPNDRCPSALFLKSLDQQYGKKFKGSFDALSKMGVAYRNEQRFKALTGAGKPLWEFKEHDHRLYCFRLVEGERVAVALLDGWVKDKAGVHKQETNRIESAHNLLREFLAEFPEGRIPGGYV
jgi:hypothetical protein